jgi:hypothetical protein
MNDEELEEDDEGCPAHFLSLVRAARASKGRFPVRYIQGAAMGPTALAFSPDSRSIASGGAGGVSMFDDSSGIPVGGFWWDGRIKGDRIQEKKCLDYEFPDYMNYIMYSVVFTPDGRTIVAGDRIGDVYAWDVATGALRWRKAGEKHGAGGEGHKSDTVVAASPGGKVVASSGRDGYVRTWDVETGGMVAEVDMASAGHPYVDVENPDKVYPYPYKGATLYGLPNVVREYFDVHALAFSPDGHWLACGMSFAADILDPVLAIDTRTWIACNVAEFPVRELPNRDNPKIMESAYEATNHIGFSKDGRWLVTAGDEGARVYEVIEVGSDDRCMRMVGGTVIGYDWRKESTRGWTPGTRGAAFLGGSSTVAILHERGVIEGIDVQGVLAARGGLDKPGEPGDVQPAFVAFAGKREDNSFDASLVASPDGRWLAVGSRFGTGFFTIDLRTQSE